MGTTLERAGITRRIRPYDLRHMYGTELVASGVDIGTVCKLMGHSLPIMLLKHYQYVMDKQKVEARPKLEYDFQYGSNIWFLMYMWRPQADLNRC